VSSYRGWHMTISSDAVRAYEHDLLQKADILMLALKGLQAAAPERAALIVDEIAARLRRGADDGAMMGGPAPLAPAGDGNLRERSDQPRRPAPLIVAARGGGADDIEDFILDILAENPTGLSVQDIVDSLDAAELEIKRKTLVVRLHRMAHAGRLSPQAHGHYTLSDTERSRRRRA
jgi:hypothetical protein